MKTLKKGTSQVMLPLKRSGETLISPDGGETVYIQRLIVYQTTRN